MFNEANTKQNIYFFCIWPILNDFDLKVVIVPLMMPDLISFCTYTIYYYELFFGRFIAPFYLAPFGFFLATTTTSYT